MHEPQEMPYATCRGLLASGDRQLYIRLAWEELSGRQLGLGWDPKSELPVRRTV